MTQYLSDPDRIKVFHMRTQLSALALEIKGIRFKGGSICAAIKRQQGLKGRKKVDIFCKFHELILTEERRLNIPPRPLTETEKEMFSLSV